MSNYKPHLDYTSTRTEPKSHQLTGAALKHVREFISDAFYIPPKGVDLRRKENRLLKG